MLRLSYLTLTWLATVSTMFATAQQPDRLRVECEEHALHSNPLETYFGKYPERRPKEDGTTFTTNTSLWRGYIATFEIVDGQFRVRDVSLVAYDEKAQYGQRLVSKLDYVFPKDVSRALTWFTGFLILPQGKLLNYDFRPNSAKEAAPKQ